MNDLSLHLLDILQNALSAGATFIEILVNEQPESNVLTLCVQDNGKGMTKNHINKIDNLCYTSCAKQKPGLGLPCLKQSALKGGGKLVITSKINVGTKITATFAYHHTGRLPLGNIPNTIMLMVYANPLVRFSYTHCYKQKKYIFDTLEIKKVLGNILPNDPEIIRDLEKMISENINKCYNN